MLRKKGKRNRAILQKECHIIYMPSLVTHDDVVSQSHKVPLGFTRNIILDYEPDKLHIFRF